LRPLGPDAVVFETLLHIVLQQSGVKNIPDNRLKLCRELLLPAYHLAHVQRSGSIFNSWLLENSLVGSVDSELADTVRKFESARKRRLDIQVKTIGWLESTLKQHAMPFLFLKGAFFLNHNVNFGRMRHMSDIDLLLPQGAVNPLCSILYRAGFERKRPQLPYRWHDKIALKYGNFLDCAEGRGVLVSEEAELDVHWDPIYQVDGNAVRFSLAEIWAAEKLQGRDSNFCIAFTYLHMLIHLIHTSHEDRFRIGRFIDIVIFRRQFGFLDFSGAQFRSIAEGMICCERSGSVWSKILEFEECCRDLSDASLGSFLRLMSEAKAPQWQRPHDVHILLDARIRLIDKVVFAFGYFFPPKDTSVDGNPIERWVRHLFRLTSRFFQGVWSLIRNGFNQNRSKAPDHNG
jgi:hypothetical protein